MDQELLFVLYADNDTDEWAFENTSLSAQLHNMPYQVWIL
jgi:hypothetical protein